MWSQITEWLATYGLLFILQSSHSESFLAVVTYGRKKLLKRNHSMKEMILQLLMIELVVNCDMVLH